jgi:hypothetical protein
MSFCGKCPRSIREEKYLCGKRPKAFGKKYTFVANAPEASGKKNTFVADVPERLERNIPLWQTFQSVWEEIYHCGKRPEASGKKNTFVANVPAHSGACAIRRKYCFVCVILV